MAIPKCPDPNCGHKIFQITTVSPISANFKVNIVHCAKCGCSIGAMDFYAVGTNLEKIMRHLKI